MPLLSPENQLKVLSKIWGPQRKGYCFLPWIPGTAEDKDQRRKGYREGRAYRWPADKPAILAHLKEHQKDELYFSVNLFSGKRRVENLVLPDRALYSDLDEVDPRRLDDQPTIAWESSPGRFQGVWLLSEELPGSSMGGGLNHRLTNHVGGDPSGWDSTQLLRVPGRPNFKYNYRPEGADDSEWEGVKGEGLIWSTGPRYQVEDFADLPEIATPETASAIDEEVLASIDRHAVWARVRLKVPARIREMLGQRDLPEGTDRSNGAWEIARDLADVGCSSLEIVAILRPTPWNKYAGRHDELKRLILTASKAVGERPISVSLEDQGESQKPGITWLSDVVAKPIPRPRWLIKNIWTRGGCGFISGAPKSYKSWMALDLAVSVASGHPFLGDYAIPRPGPVLYLQEEDDLRLVMERLSYIVEAKVPNDYWDGQITWSGNGKIFNWAPPERSLPIALQVQTGFTSSDEGWQAWLDEQIITHRFKLIIIDTLGTTAGDVDTDRAQTLMERMLRPLKVLAKKHDTAIAIVHHNRKNSGEGRAGNDMLGSVALHAWVDCAIYARSRDNSGVVQVEREAKLAPELSLKLQIPFIFHDQRTGERKLWEPITELPGVGEAQPQETRDDPPAKAHSTGGSAIATKLKAMGRGPHSLEKICAIVGSSEAKVLSQLEKGIENGIISEDAGRYALVR